MPPTIGLLHIGNEVARRLPRANELRRGAMLLPSQAAVDPIVQLHSCILHKANFRGLVLVGVEEFWNRKNRTDYPQAWWLRAPSRPVAASPTGVDDERDEIDRALAVA